MILYMDGGSVADRDLYEKARAIAEEQGIPWQTKHMVAGGNDARAIQQTGCGARTLVLSAAVRYLHAPSSVGCIRDFEHIHTLARHMIGAIAQEEV